MPRQPSFDDSTEDEQVISKILKQNVSLIKKREPGESRDESVQNWPKIVLFPSNFSMVLNPAKFFGAGVSIENYTGAVATAVFYGLILGFISPTIYQALLPPPIDWIPEEFLEIRRARIEFILKTIEKLSK